MIVYLDSSLLLALVGPESLPYIDGAERALKEGHRLATSTLAILEGVAAVPFVEKVVPLLDKLCADTYSLGSAEQTEALHLMHRHGLAPGQAHHAAIALCNRAAMYSLLVYGIPGLHAYPLHP